MRKSIGVVCALALAVGLGGCCSQSLVRYWRVTDMTTQRAFWAADTELAPIGGLIGPQFISSEGRIVGLASYEMESIDRDTWERESGAHARAVFRERVGCAAQIQYGPRPAAKPRAEE